jgi:hypothetical protein
VAATATETTVTDPVKAVTETVAAEVTITVAAEATKTVAGVAETSTVDEENSADVSAFALSGESGAARVLKIPADISLAMALPDAKNDEIVRATRSFALISEPSILTLMVLGLFGLLGLNRLKS